jgi:hypothetical protein
MRTGAAKPTRPATSLVLAVKVCSMFYEANERPRHATATVVIRSKPIAPGWAPVGNHCAVIVDRLGLQSKSPPRP